MGMTITEKILAQAAGRESVKPGENIWIKTDLLMTHDVCGPPTIGIFKEQFGQQARVFDPEKVVFIPDHYIFTQDTHAQRNLEILREFAKGQGITHFFDAHSERYQGVCHVTLAQEGFNLPGSVLFGTDSHTCTSGAFGMFSTGIGNTDAALIMGTGKIWVKVPETMRFIFHNRIPDHVMAKDMILRVLGEIGVDGATYRTMEFSGDAINALSMEERMTICNMAIEGGGKNGIIEADAVTEAYLKGRTRNPYTIYRSDQDAGFHSVREYDAADLQPQVAQPHSPDKVSAVDSLAGTKLDRAYIGSCTGGKTEDFLAAARILQGRKVKIETFIVPSTVQVDKELDQKRVAGSSLRTIFDQAGCKIGPPSCAACLGGPQDTFGRMNQGGQVISTTNRNFPGRMGSKEAGIYLASPFTVAASAVEGEIADPAHYL